MNSNGSSTDTDFLLRDTLHELLKNVLSHDGNDGDLFWERIYSTFYYCLQKKQGKIRRTKNMRETIEKEKIKDLVKESSVVIDTFNDIKNLENGTYKDLKKIVENEFLAAISSSATKFSNIRNQMGGEMGHGNSSENMRQNNQNITSVDEFYQNFMNVKKMDGIVEVYINGIWNKCSSKYRYIRRRKWKKKNSSEECRNNIKRKSIEGYLNKLNNECAIIEVSDSSDDDIYMNSAKIVEMFKKLNKVIATNNDPFSLTKESSRESANYAFKKKNASSVTYSNKICKNTEQWKMIDKKKQCIIHPLFNAKHIGFKIEVNDFFNRQLDIYCINDTEYINVYKNTAQFLPDNFNNQFAKRYKSLHKLKEEFEQNRTKKAQVVKNLFNERDNLLLSQNNNLIREYFVIIDETEDINEYENEYENGQEHEQMKENVRGNTFFIDIYNCSELTTYIVHSRQEKMNNFYERFVKNEIYTNEWKQKIETKFLNYNYIYDSATVLEKSDVSYAMAQIKSMVENLYCENFDQVSYVSCLYTSHKQLDSINPQDIILKKMYSDVEKFAMYVDKYILCDGQHLINSQWKNGSNSLQWKFYNYLMNYKWNKKSNTNFMENMKKYKNVLLYYILYLFPQFLNICSVIRLNNFKESMKFVFESQHEKYDSLKEVFAPNIYDIELANKAKHLSDSVTNINKYLPPFNKNGTNIMDAFPLKHLLLLDNNSIISSHLYTYFLQVLENKKQLVDLINEVHPVCLNTLRYVKNAAKILDYIQITEVAKIFFILNAYLCFLSNHVTSCEESKLWTTFLYGDSASQNKEILSKHLNGVLYMPPSFLKHFSAGLLFKKGKMYIISLEAKGKVYARALLLQLYLTNNHMPSYLVFKHNDYKTVLDAFNLQADGQYVSFRWR